MRSRTESSRRSSGFTLVELLLAGVITAFVLGAVSLCLRQLSDAKGNSRLQLQAYLRADSALSALRRDLVTVLRDQDLFWTRLLLLDGVVQSPLGHLDRDEILVFNAQLRAVHDYDFVGDGIEFEAQFRIEDDPLGPVLWHRRDSVPDQYPRGGGVATPLVAGILSLSIEAYDGDQWYQEWDSDWDGLPMALRVTVVASGHADERDPFDAPLVTLRTVVPIDRVPPPVDEAALEEEEQAADELPDEGDLPQDTPESGDTGEPGPKTGPTGPTGPTGGGGGGVRPDVGGTGPSGTRSGGSRPPSTSDRGGDDT